MSNSIKSYLRIHGFGVVEKDEQGNVCITTRVRNSDNAKQNGEPNDKKVSIPIRDRELTPVLEGLMGTFITYEGRINGWKKEGYERYIPIINLDKVLKKSGEAKFVPLGKMRFSGYAHVEKATINSMSNGTKVLNLDTDLGQISKFYGPTLKHPTPEMVQGTNIYTEGSISANTVLSKDGNNVPKTFIDMRANDIFIINDVAYEKDFDAIFNNKDNNASSSNQTTEHNEQDHNNTADEVSYV